MRAGHRCEGRGSDTVFISYFLVETTQQLFTFANKSETVRSYQPYPWLISTTYMALINHIHGSYQPHPWLISTTSMALINHIHGSYQPHTWLISTTSKTAALVSTTFDTQRTKMTLDTVRYFGDYLVLYRYFGEMKIQYNIMRTCSTGISIWLSAIHSPDQHTTNQPRSCIDSDLDAGK